jgi:hypothetical protein
MHLRALNGQAQLRQRAFACQCGVIVDCRWLVENTGQSAVELDQLALRHDDPGVSD